MCSSLCRVYTGKQRRHQKRRKQYADPRAKRQGPPQRIDEQPEIARVADDAVGAASDQRMSGLDRDQPAETPPEYKNRPDPQQATGGEQCDTEPTNGLPIKDPEPLPVGVGRQVGGEDTDQTKGGDDPAVGSILALARLRLPLVNSAAPVNRKSVMASAISAEWEKNAANPPEPRMASPR